MDCFNRYEYAIDSLDFGSQRSILEENVLELLIDTNVRRLDLKSGKVIQLHAFSQKIVGSSIEAPKERVETFNQILPHLKDAIKQANQIVMATGALSVWYDVGEERVSQILNEIEKLGKLNKVQWLIDSSTGLPISPTYHAGKQDYDWTLREDVNYKRVQTGDHD